MKDYPFNKCLHPLQTVNPYTRQPITVNCGKCSACLLHKASISTLKCKLESLSHKYCMFVTLTYNDSSIPRANAFYNETLKVYSIKDDTIRFIKYRDLYRCHLCDVDTSLSDMSLLEQKFQNGRIPYLCKKDLQLFLKRLRKNLSKYTDEKIRYYAVGEYGPLHFRPHFHLLVWFDEAVTFQNFSKALYQSWRFGNIRSELSRGDCSSYVASYLNSDSNLPKVLKSSSTKPFCCHSSKLGEVVLRERRKEAYEMSYKDFVSSSLQFDGKLQDVLLWRSLEAWYFPKCRDYSSKSRGDLFYAYSIFKTASEFAGVMSPYRAAKAICYHLYTDFFDYEDTLTESQKRMFDFFSTHQRFSVKKTLTRSMSDLWEQMFRSIYKDLYVSHHFLTKVCDTQGNLFPNQNEINKKITCIQNHYLERDYDMLLKQFEYSDMLLKSAMYHDEEVVFSDCWKNPKKAFTIPYLYDNVKYDVDEFNESPLPRMFISDVTQRSYSSVKHKLANDANLIFNNK